MGAQGLHCIFIWATLLILFEPYHDTTGSCFHKNQQEGSVINMSAVEQWPVGGENKRFKRHTQDLYGPIRITLVYSLDQHLSNDERAALINVLERAVQRISSLLSVVNRKDPLLLPRSACSAVFREGVNKGKCAMVQKKYTGEYCMDKFKITPMHLEGFVVYNLTHPEPAKVYAKDGPGLKDTDFVLYVTSDMTPLCNPYRTSAMAYAAYCKLDNTSRPIAGQVNFCPRTVKAQKFDKELLYKTSIHELFHALGFSNKLFDKFKNCDNVGVCEPWPQPMTKPVDGTMRLVTSAVMREMRRHFNCTSELDFGGPLEVEDGRVTSHWDPLLMHSSIMGSKEQKPYQTLIDPISLAVFEDTGWYRVNYSLADKFIWGRGHGCSFGLQNVCKHQEGFCTRNITGCHHLRLSKARCNVNSKTGCGVFAADPKPCFLNSENTSSAEEIFSSSSRCFLSSLKQTKLSSTQDLASVEHSGKCYERKCEKDSYSIRVQDGEWLSCVPGSYVQAEGFEGSILCASYEQICSDFIHPEPTMDTVTSTSISEINLVNITKAPATTERRPDFVISTAADNVSGIPSRSFVSLVDFVIAALVIFST